MSLQTEVKPFYHVPLTVSDQAKTILSQSVPVGGVIKTKEEFQSVREGFAQFSRSDSDQATEMHVKEIKRISLADVDVTVVTPKGDDGSTAGKILVYVHGGAYTLGSADHLFQVFAPVADQAKLKTYAVNYRLAPEYPFPAGLNDCLRVYNTLLKTHQARNIFFLGDSAGGGLILAAMQKARDEEHLPMPGAIGLFSPMAEAEKKGDTFYTLEGRSPVLQYEKSLKPSLDVYVPNGVSLNDPGVSPINGSFKKFPPTMIVSGTRDAFLSTSVRLQRKLKNEGVLTELDLYEGMGHGFQQTFDLPEARESRAEMAKFFLKVMEENCTLDSKIAEGNTHR